MTPGSANSIKGVRWATSALSAAALVTCAGAFWASSTGVFAGQAAARAAGPTGQDEAAIARAEHAAFTRFYRGLESRDIRVAPGEHLARALVRAGAEPGDAAAAIRAVSGVYDPRRVRAGQSFTLEFVSEDGAPARFSGLSFRSAPGAAVTVARTVDGFTAREVEMPLTYEIARVADRVSTSIYEGAVAQGATDREVAALAEVFGYDVDFQRDVRRGDQFELVFERFFDDEGATVRTGELLFVSLETRGQLRSFYRFQAPGDTQPEWYDAEGKSARKFLMKTPINGARLSSNFGMRRHPILGYSRMHQGTDFAAPTGTPIMAAGDGVIDFAGVRGGYGNYIRIRHGDQYETAYAHMSRFARGMRNGVRVRQGQVIGYVGTTGRSTGPHLHYEVLLRGRHINPMGIRVPTGRNLEGEALVAFQQERARIDRLRAARAAETRVTTAQLTPTAARQP